MAAAISISGMISTSGEITVSTIETLNLKNVGIFFLGTTELEIYLGVILPPWTPEGVKNPGHLRVKGLGLIGWG